MSLTEQELLNLKDQVEEAKTKVSELRGQETALMKQLLDDWNCKSIKEAQTKLAGMEKGIETLEIEIKKAVKELEEKYNIDE